MKKIESSSSPTKGILTEAAKPVAVPDRAALNYFGTSTRDLLSEEAGACTSLVSVLDVSHAMLEKRDMVIVDVRTAQDYATGNIPGAVSLPREKWELAPGLSKEKVNVVYCYSHTCPLGGEACAKLAGEGYPVVEMDGGFGVWKTLGLDVEQKTESSPDESLGRKKAGEQAQV